MPRAGDDPSTKDAVTGHLELDEATCDAAGRPAAVAEVRDALRRLDNQEYGWCEACGRSIPLERLEAIPHTRHCVACHAPSPGLVS
jgi:RNA polymerase-binding transcription factor DksA